MIRFTVGWVAPYSAGEDAFV